MKICTASRPWNVFQKAYGNDTERLLTVHEFTIKDIETYVTSTSMANKHFRSLYVEDRSAHTLIEELTTKAQGVFLWVFLASRNLLRGLVEGDNTQTLRERVREFPPTLEGYYDRMLKSLHKVYQKESARILLQALFNCESFGLPLHGALLHLCRDFTA